MVGGRQDWGMYQQPGALEKMASACAAFHGVVFVDGAGHWVQQEQPEEVVRLVLEFLGKT
jgi:pimeloyl-ACP methyl ester carboxylesterase